MWRRDTMGGDALSVGNVRTLACTLRGRPLILSSAGVTYYNLLFFKDYF